MQGVWEAGKQLSLRNLSSDARNIITWVDKNNDGVVTCGRTNGLQFGQCGNVRPYLRASATGDYTAANIISFLHGNQVTNMRDRQVLVNGLM